MFRTTRVPPVLSLLLLVAPAAAQPAAVEAPPAGPPAAPEAPARPAPPVPPAAVALPEISDPMLHPVPRAKRVLTSWQQALRLLRSRSSSLRLSAAQTQQAAGQARLALAGALPTLTGTASLRHHLLTGDGFNFTNGGLVQGTIPDPNPTWTTGLALRVPLFAPKAWHDAGTARDSVRVSQLNEREAERQVIASAADAIVSAVTAERLAEISRVSLRSALSSRDLTRRRARAGAAGAFDVLRAEQEVTLTRSQIVATDETVRLTREALGMALGSAEAYGVTTKINLDSILGDAASSCQSEQSVEARPDVVAARATVDVAERNVDSTDWQYLPTLDAVSNLDLYDPDTRTPNGERVTWTVGALLTWQLYDGGVRYGARDANQGQLTMAREQLTQARRRAKVEVTQARRGVSVAQANLDVSRRTRDLAQQSARLARIAFVSGSGNSFDLIDATKRLREAEIDLAVKEFQVVRAQILAMLALASCDV